MPKVQVAVCGPSAATPLELAQAREVGERLAERDAVVLCGGYAGVMSEVAAGAASRGGTVIGILSGADRTGASPDLTHVVVTGIGEARNAVLVRSADAVIVIGGSWGTLSELAFAAKRTDPQLGRPVPVVCLSGWRVTDADGSPIPGPLYADSPAAAVALALADS